MAGAARPKEPLHISHPAALVGCLHLVDGERGSARVEGVGAKLMRSMIDDLRNKLGSGVVCLISENDGKVLVAIGVTKDQTENHPAGDLIRDVAGLVGGGGGGRPDFAQAGGKDASKIDAAIEKFYQRVGANGSP